MITTENRRRSNYTEDFKRYAVALVTEQGYKISEAARAWMSATNGRGPWRNAGASYMNQSFPKSYFDRSGLVSLLDHYHFLKHAS